MNHLVLTLRWVLTVRGVVMILFGLALLFLPSLVLQQLLALIFGITVLFDGAMNAVGAVQARKDVTDWYVYLVEGAFSVFLGSTTIFWSGIGSGSLLVMIAFWAIVTGIARMVAAIGLRRLITGELVLLFSGILSTVFGFVMLVLPQARTWIFAYVIGFYAVLLGVLLLALAWRITTEDGRTTQDVAGSEIDGPQVEENLEKNETGVTKVASADGSVQSESTTDFLD